MTSSQRIDEQAAHWAVRLQQGSVAAEEQSVLDEWLAADSRHPGALLRAQAIWLDLERVGALAAGREVAEIRSKPWYSNAQLLRVAAAVVALSVGAIVWWAQVYRPDVYISDVGEVRRVRLKDGSSMVLNTATRATVHIDESLREIKLGEGEGVFEVAKDPARPFIVRAGAVSVRAVGTVFSVRSVNEQVSVVVTEGVVELSDDSRNSDAPRRIAANEQVTVTPTRQPEVTPVTREQAERRLVWRDGLVEFDGETLHYAVTEINRYNHRQIVIDNPALASRPVVGLFRASDPENFAATIAVALQVRSVSAADAIHIK
ncbi:FecR family protein [Steroidobacter sp.]|uniref:FecR family protein n=1 Tax=Steroidobacter sp. TaxID=1978227 RepID=UPI001A479BBD|nr:FecR domain-containing protein [Steroidobacter sp.]MBL8268011.1 FecR domain-containing protein [Steroidobacter sp.]